MKYRCMCLVEHDGRRYEAGAILQISGKQADELLKCGAIELFNKPFAAKRVTVSLQSKENDDV